LIINNEEFIIPYSAIYILNPLWCAIPENDEERERYREVIKSIREYLEKAHRKEVEDEQKILGRISRLHASKR